MIRIRMHKTPSLCNGILAFLAAAKLKFPREAKALFEKADEWSRVVQGKCRREASIYRIARSSPNYHYQTVNKLALDSFIQ